MKNSDTNQHDLVGVVSWGDGCAAVGMVNAGHGDDKLLLMIICVQASMHMVYGI